MNHYCILLHNIFNTCNCKQHDLPSVLLLHHHCGLDQILCFTITNDKGGLFSVHILYFYIKGTVPVISYGQNEIKYAIMPYSTSSLGDLGDDGNKGLLRFRSC